MSRLSQLVSKLHLLSEEVIGADEGRFRKYMNNVSPVPIRFSDAADEE